MVHIMPVDRGEQSAAWANHFQYDQKNKDQASGPWSLSELADEVCFY
jgi:hypothetical protein